MVEPLLPARVPRLWDADIRYTKWIMALREKQRVGTLHFSWDPQDPDGINCLTLASQAVESQTGVNLHDMLQKVDPTTRSYTTPLGAGLVLKRMGLDGVEGLMGALFTWKPISMLSRGDLGLAPANTLPDDQLSWSTLAEVERSVWSVGIVVVDPPFYWGATEAGLGKGNMCDLVKGYHVGT